MLKIRLILAGLVSAAFPFVGLAEPDTLASRKPVGPIEVQDQPLMTRAKETTKVSAGYRFSNGGFSIVQVNVDSLGMNIVGDAANEPSLAVSPVDSSKIAIGWRQFDTIASSFRQAGYGYSTDAGLTWRFPGVLDPGVFRSDPVLESDSEGNFYYYSLTNSPDYHCTMYRSADGGATWSAGTYAYGGDKAWMTIDQSDGIGHDQLYFSWDYAGCCGDDWFNLTADRGQTFTSPIPIPEQPIWGVNTVGPDGAVYVAGRLYFTNAQFAVAKSSTVQDTSVTPAFDWGVVVDMGGEHHFSIGYGPNPGGLLGQAWIDADRSSGPNAGNLYVLCSVDPPGADPMDVHFVRSTDGGVSWTAPMKVNDNPDSTSWQWFGTMAVAPTGRIDAIWLDTRDNPGSVSSSLYHAYSIDGGTSWSANARLSDEFNPLVGWPQQDKLGDYYDMVSDENGAHIAWAATFNGEQDVYYSRLTVVTGAETDPGNNMPKVFSLSQNYPNPFNPTTTIDYEVPDRVLVNLQVFDVLGREVSTLVREMREAGTHSVTWDAASQPSGVFFYRLQAGGFVGTRKLVLMR
jgi:hypothetical protein